MGDVRLTESEYQTILLRTQRGNPQAPPAESVARESDLHDAIAAYCTARQWVVFHSRMDRRTTTGVGLPDFVILADGGRTFLIEAKSKLGKLRPEQLGVILWAERRGHTIHVVRSMGEFLEIVASFFPVL